jgi:hypothetical protein
MKNKLLFFFFTLISQINYAQVPSYVPVNGLKAWYPFNGNTNDESGSGNNGTVIGATLTSDRNNTTNSSYLFTGTSNKISIANSFFNNGWANYTISIWFNPSSNLTYNGCLINTSPHDGTGIAYSNYGTNKKLYHSKNSNTSVHVWDILNNDSFNYPSFEFNTWYNIIIIKSNNTYHYYVNGVLDKSISSNIIPNQDMCGLIFGNIDLGPGYNPEPFNGKLDDIGIWNRALTQQEISNLYNPSLSTTACLPANISTNGLMGYWPFCGNANDESGNGNNGTIYGTTLISDRFGNNNSAYSFNGSSNYISIPYSSSIGVQQNISVSFWVYMNGGGCGPRILQSQPWGQCGGYYIATNGTSNTARSFSGSIDNCIAGVGGNSSALLNSLSWHNVVFTASGLTGKYEFYYDGTLVNITNTNQFFSSINYNNHSLILGNIDPNSCDWFGGYLDDIGIWNRILTQQEITDLNTSLSTEQTIANNQITVYPNPAKEQITIDCGNLSNTSGWSFQILNTLGQEVLNGKINSQQNVVPLNSLNGTGVYLVKIYDASNNLLNTKKIVLN